MAMKSGAFEWEGHAVAWEGDERYLQVTAGNKPIVNITGHGKRLSDATVKAILDKSKREYLRRIGAKPPEVKKLSPRVEARAKAGNFGVQTKPWTHGW